MINRVVDRYDRAGEPHTQAIYVDRDCCGDNQLRRWFHAWPNMVFRLDIWHFMRRFFMGCSTDSHILYSTFMKRLSKAIFEWSAEDLEALRQAKRLELMTQHMIEPLPGKTLYAGCLSQSSPLTAAGVPGEQRRPPG